MVEHIDKPALELKGYRETPVMFDCLAERVRFEADGDFCYMIRNIEFFRDNKNNVLIIERTDNEGEEVDDLNEVLNSLPEPAYDHLIEVLNNNRDITVHLSQCDMYTTSDFTIFHEPFDNWKTLQGKMEKVGQGAKYNEVRNGVLEPVDFCLTGWSLESIHKYIKNNLH